MTKRAFLAAILTICLTISGAAYAQESLIDMDTSLGAVRPSESITERPIAPATDSDTLSSIKKVQQRKANAVATKKVIVKGQKSVTAGKKKIVTAKKKVSTAEKKKTVKAQAESRKAFKAAVAKVKKVKATSASGEAATKQ